MALIRKCKDVFLYGTVILLLGSLMPHAYANDKERCRINGNIPNDGPAGESYQKDKMTQMLLDVPSPIDMYIKDWSRDDQNNFSMCLFDDGRPWISTLRPAYEQSFDIFKDWSQALNQLNRNKIKNQKSASLALQEADYWIQYAWDARGRGFGSSVTDEGWKLFRERLLKAEKILVDTKPYSSDLPMWYDEMIVVQSALDRSPVERDKVFLEGAEKFKTYYPTYFTILNFLSPKWGGSWGAVDNLVTWSVNNTKETEGKSMYTRMYWAAYQGLPEGTKLFRDSYVSWPKMKAGFDDLMQRFPNSNWNLNNYAKFACLANDKKTFIALRKKIGTNIIPDAWTLDANQDLCDQKFNFSRSVK
ncbi:MAG TPA: hypothetical protein VIE91_07400 [Methylophilaceae bacterium]